MKKCTLRLAAAILIMAALLFSQVFTAFAGWEDDPFICVTKDLIDGKYVFRVKRVMNSATGILNSSTDITFTYKITCENDAYEVLKVVEGQSGIPAGINDVTIDVAELVEEMRKELPKYNSITIECNLRSVKGATLGTIDQIILNNTSGMSEEDMKAWQEALSEMFENMEEKSGKADTADAGSNFKGASSWAQAELQKAAGYGFITDSIKDNMSAPITREEFAEVAVKLYEKYTGKKAVTGDMSVFSDTSNPEVFKAYNLKIVNGTDIAKKLFSPKGQVNRQQVAAMLYRTINAMNPGADLRTSGAGRFADEKDIAPWALEAVRFMNKNGFLKGSDNKIDPNGICTREMSVIIATRVYEKYSGNTIPEGGKDTLNNGIPRTSEPKEQVDAGYDKLPAHFPKIVPMLPDAIITIAEGFKGDENGFIIYGTNYSVDEAIEFYSNKNLYKGFISMTPKEDQNVKSIWIEIQGYNIMVSVSDESGSGVARTGILINIFGTGFSQG